MNEIDLKIWLASQLPEEIIDHINGAYELEFHWMDTETFVTEREWDNIVRRVEAKLTDAQQFRYSAKLVQLSNWDRAKDNVFKVATLSWQQRTIALMEVLK